VDLREYIVEQSAGEVFVRENAQKYSSRRVEQSSSSAHLSNYHRHQFRSLNEIIFEKDTWIELDDNCCSIHNWDVERHSFKRDHCCCTNSGEIPSVARTCHTQGCCDTPAESKDNKLASSIATSTDADHTHTTTTTPTKSITNECGEEVFCVRGDQDANFFSLPDLRELRSVETDQNSSYVVKNCADSIHIFSDHLHYIVQKKCRRHLHQLLKYAIVLYDKHLHNESFPLFKLLVEEQVEDALYYLAVMLDSGRGCTKDTELAKKLCEQTFKVLKERADRGDCTAFLNYARLYDFGFGTRVDLQKAAEWYQRAVDEGNSSIALYNLSIMYHNGEGVPKDVKKSFELAHRSSQLGYADAQYHCANTLKAEKKGSEAVFWYKKAIRSGSLSAVNALASMYYEGKLVKKHLSMAIRLWKIAVEKGNPAASYNCAYRYLDGVGLRQDYCNALHLFRLSVEREEKRIEEVTYYNQLHSNPSTSSSVSEETTMHSRHLQDVLMQLIQSQRREYLSKSIYPRNRRGQLVYFQLANDFYHGYSGKKDIDESVKLFECAAVHERRKKALLHLFQIHYYLDSSTVRHQSLKKAKFYLHLLRETHYRSVTLLMVASEISFFESMYKTTVSGTWSDVDVVCEDQQ